MKSTLDAVPKRKCISVFKVGKLWLFKVFFDNRELFNALLDYYNKDLFRFELKTLGRGTRPSRFWRGASSTIDWWRTRKATWSSSQNSRSMPRFEEHRGH